MQQQPGQDVASFAVDVLKAARGLEMTQAQLVRLVLGGLHAKVTPFVEMSQPQTVEELLCCPAAAKGMTAPAMERDVMACTTHSIELTGHGSDRAEQVTTRDGEYAPGQLGRQRYGGSAGYEGDQTCHALVDSGAHHSIISDGLLSKIPKKRVKFAKPKCSAVTGVGGITQ